MITQMNPQEAEEWIVNFCAQVVGIEANARQLREFAAAHFTEDARQKQIGNTLIQGQDTDGNEITWTTDQLSKVRRAFDLADLLVETLQRKGNDGRPLIAAFQAQIRPIPGGQRRPTP